MTSKMKDVKKIGVYFLMHEDKPDMNSIFKIARELHMRGFDEDMFQPIMLLSPVQMRSFLKGISENCIPGIRPSHDNFHKWIFAGFMFRTLYGKIE